MALASSLPESFYILKGVRDEYDKKVYYGRVRIFINHIFKNLKGFQFNQQDVEAIKNSFTKLHFKVDEPIMNKTANEMKTHFAEQMNYFGCAIIFVFSHGQENFICGTDFNGKDGSGKINVWDHYYHNFSAVKKPEMKDCPKIFFNEFCQSRAKTCFAEAHDKLTCASYNTAHWLIYNAAQPGYAALVRKDGYSFSTQAFCRCLNEFGESKHLDEILTMVKNDDYKLALSEKDFLQPIVYSSLLKKLYLLPENKAFEITTTYGRKFQHIDVLGSGRYGVVFRAKNVVDEKEYAVKRIQLSKSTEPIREFKLLAKISGCRFIVRYHDAWYESVDFECQSKQDSERKITGLLNIESITHLCFIQMELCGETLYQWLKRIRQRDKVKSLKIFKQIVEGLAYLHNENMVHRDLKPSNILFAINNNDSDVSVRIADFGLARHFDNFTCSAAGGSLLYMAPETLRNKCYPKSDMFSVGLILIELLYDCSGKDGMKILNDAKDDELPESFNNELNFAVPTLTKLLSYNFRDRLSSEEMLKILCTDPDWNEEAMRSISSQVAKIIVQQKEWKFESTCTSKEHLVSQKSLWTSEATFTWDGDKDLSGWLGLPTVSACNTQWEVQFSSSNKNLAINVFCKSLDEQFRAASFRLLAIVENHPEVWREVAAVLKSNEKLGWWSYFPKKLNEFFKGLPIKIHVRIKWTELEQLTLTPDLWKNDDTIRIQCHWQLHRWKTVSPTIDNEWCLYSEPFGRDGLVWRIIVINSCDDNNRKLEVRVELQHIPTSIDCTGLSMHCSLSLWKKCYDEQMEDMDENSYCDWTVIDAMKLESRDPLDLIVIICIKRM